MLRNIFTSLTYGLWQNRPKLVLYLACAMRHLYINLCIYKKWWQWLFCSYFRFCVRQKEHNAKNAKTESHQNSYI